MAARIALYVLAALLAGAHFLREGNLLAVAACAAAPLLFLWRDYRALLALQGLAYLATGVWILTALHLVDQRTLAGRPWTAAALILGAVALVTLLAGLLLNGRAVRARYPR